MFYICSMTGLHIIWFRNDLRVHDHAALRAACNAAARDGGDVLALYIETPEPDDRSEQQHLSASLGQLRSALEHKGALLHMRTGRSEDVFSELHRLHGISSLHMHEVPFEDPDAPHLQSWALRAGVAFRTYAQFGPADSSDEFASLDEAWTRYMAQPRFETPEINRAANVGVGQNLVPSDQTEGGRREAIESLRAFLGSVSDPQRIAITEAESGAAFYERLKPFLLLGVLSLREVWQAASSAHHQMQRAGQDIRAASIKSLLRRLPELHKQRALDRTVDSALNARHYGDKGQQLSLGL